jgi:hypothetical protein
MLGEESESRSHGMKPGIGERVLNSVMPEVDDKREV